LKSIYFEYFYFDNLCIYTYLFYTYIFSLLYSYSYVFIIFRFMPPEKYMEVSLHTVPTTLITNPEKEELKSWNMYILFQSYFFSVTLQDFTTINTRTHNVNAFKYLFDYKFYDLCNNITYLEYISTLKKHSIKIYVPSNQLLGQFKLSIHQHWYRDV